MVKLSKASILGQSTFGMKDTEGEEFEELQIKDASKAIGKVLNNLKEKNEVDLLHVNCEVRMSFYTFSFLFSLKVEQLCLQQIST